MNKSDIGSVTDSDDETESVASTNAGSDDTGSVGFSKKAGLNESGEGLDFSDDDDFYQEGQEKEGQEGQEKEGQEEEAGELSLSKKGDDSSDGNDSNDDDDDDDDDDDGDDDDKDLHKFDNETKKKYIANFHPECLSFNHEETETLSRVVRDENGRIVDPLHKTLPFLTKYEKTRILGIRTKQINEGAKPYVDVNPTIIDGYIIAQLELEHKKLPFIIRRPIPNGGSELWKLQDLEIIC
jgi:DNA-directed RNA polymerase I, II, and III subunit RPABC2